MAIKRLRTLHKVIAGAALIGLVAACGTPPLLRPRNIADATAAPVAVAQAETHEDFVVIWLLFGTPTPGGPGAYPVPIESAQTKVAAIDPGANGGTPAPTTSGDHGGDHSETKPTLPATSTPASLPATSTPAAVANASGNTSVGNADKGKTLFAGVGTCSSCHDVQQGMTIVGPTLKGIVGRAASRKPGMSAQEYLHESIVNPNAFVVQGFAQGIMPSTFKNTLNETQINDIIAYLMTLK